MKEGNDITFRIFRFETLESTNGYAQDHLSELDNLSVIVADWQTAGRGQRGNRWLAAPGENLTFSLVLKPEALLAREQMQLTALASVALRGALLEAGFPPRIKWPNDLYVGDSKLAGMLIENRLFGDHIEASVIGIGLNVNQTAFDPCLSNPTSLKALCGRSFSCDEVLESILRHFAAWLPKIDTPALWEAYTGELYAIGERRQWKDSATGTTFYGTIKGVRRDGRLMIRLDDGTLRLPAFKEIEYIL